MAEIVNLRMARKARARASDKAQARANRALHGRTKGERLADQAEITRITRTVEGAKRERPSSEETVDQSITTHPMTAGEDT